MSLDGFLHDFVINKSALCYVAAAVQLVREATEDVVLKIPGRNGDQMDREVALKKGTVTCIDIIGIST